MKVTVMKKKSKWAIYDEEGKEQYTGKTRVECFRYANKNKWQIASFQHGGK